MVIRIKGSIQEKQRLKYKHKNNTDIKNRYKYLIVFKMFLIEGFRQYKRNLNLWKKLFRIKFKEDAQ